MQETVTVAAVAVDTKPGDAGGNLRKIDAWTGRAVAANAGIVLFQELSLCGFIPNHPAGDHEAWLRSALRAARELAEPIPGPAVDQLTAIAETHGVLVSAGLLEDAGNVLYNTQVLVGPQGLLGRWRKMHIPMFEAPFYCGGGVPDVVDTPLGRIGINICFDAFLPESTRLLAVENVEIVLFPFAADPPPVSVEGWAAWAGPALRARCAENGIFGVVCNYVGRVSCAGVEQSFPGGGMVIGPRGDVVADWIAPSHEPAMLLAELTSAHLQAARSEPEYLFRFRRPELYGRLAR